MKLFDDFFLNMSQMREGLGLLFCIIYFCIIFFTAVCLILILFIKGILKIKWARLNIILARRFTRHFSHTILKMVRTGNLRATSPPITKKVATAWSLL